MTNKLFYGDNLDILRKHIKDDSIDLIYIDPPFNSKKNYNIIYDGSTAQEEVFKDTWSYRGISEQEKLVYDNDPQRYSVIHDVIRAFKILLDKSDKSLYSYLLSMAIRLVELHRVLKQTGSIYLHCDQTAGHYLKILLDEIFGRNNYQNEVIWFYKGGGSSPNKWSRKHDQIFFYTKSTKWTFNLNDVRTSYSEEILSRPKSSYKHHHYGKKENPITIKDGWDLNPLGKRPDDVIELPIINPCAKERLGYPTQKPEALLEMIIKASSNEGDIILDAFCGCGTTVAVAQRLKRYWIGIDITYIAINLVRQRLVDHYYKSKTALSDKDALKKFYEDTEIFGIPKDIESAKSLAENTANDYVRKEFEKWAVFSIGGVFSEKKGADYGYDGYLFMKDVDKNGKEIKTKCLVQAKSGDNVGIDMIKSFNSTLDDEKSPIGIFIMFNEPTKRMKEYIAGLSKYRHNFYNREYDKIVIVRVEDIINKNLPDLPIGKMTKQAEEKDTIEQKKLF